MPGCGQCKGSHPTTAGVRDCYTEARGGYLNLDDFAAEQAGEIYAEAISSWVAGGGSSEDASRYASVVANGGVWDGGIGNRPEFSGEQCDHGLALELCGGPNHYQTYEEERASYGYTDHHNPPAPQKFGGAVWFGQDG